MTARVATPEQVLAWLAAASLLAAAASTLFVLVTGALPHAWLLVAGLVGATALVVGGLRARGRALRRALGLALVVVAFALWVFGVGPLLLPLQVLALTMLVRDWPVRTGVIAWLALTGGAVLLYAAAGRDAAMVAVESAGIGLLLLFGLVFALLLRTLAQSREADAARMSALDAANARLQAMLGMEKELVLAEERARMSRELHDGLGHRLTLVTMRLELAERLADVQPATSAEAVRDARALVVESIDAMRMWVRALSPTGESGLRGRAAMDAIADSFRGTGLTVDLIGEADPSGLGGPASLVAYRIVQEGLTNALRHSGARTVRIEFRDAALSGGAPALRLTITNPLREGAPPDGVVSPGGFGLRSLGERAEAVGGTFASGPDGESFVLEAVLPKETDE